jgi:hypothetical protein
MSIGGVDQENDHDNDPNRTTKPPAQLPSLGKYGEVKRAFDMLAVTPGKTRRGVCRQGDSLRGFTDYNIKLFRSDDKRWALYVEWVDMDGEGHRVVFPHEVVAGVLQRANSIIAQGRSERGRNAALTRKAKGIIPFQKKDPKE